jgi:ATP-dependent exoDNAse (exonuclease V) beta subunit
MKTAGPKILTEVDEALQEYFGEYEVFSSEEMLYVPIENFNIYFKGFVDAVVKVGDTYHLFDWKTCSWGWDSRKKAEKMTTYQLTLYKHFFCQKHKIDPSHVETHFALLKRTAKKDRVEIFRVTSGPKKTENALKLLYQAIYNITKRFTIKNRLNCHKPYPCKLLNTKHCP